MLTDPQTSTVFSKISVRGGRDFGCLALMPETMTILRSDSQSCLRVAFPLSEFTGIRDYYVLLFNQSYVCE